MKETFVTESAVHTVVSKYSGFLLSAALLSLLLSGCSPAMVLTIPPAGNQSIEFTGAASPAAEDLLRRFSQPVSGAGGSMAFIDESLLRLSLTQAGLAVRSLNLTGGTGLAMNLELDAGQTLIKEALTLDREKRTARVELTRTLVGRTMDLLPPGTRDYLDLLMAPSLGYDDMSREEYEDLVAVAFGNTMLAELRTSRFTLTLRTPSPVKTARIPTGEGSAHIVGSSAVFNIPLAALLTLEKPIILEASW